MQTSSAIRLTTLLPMQSSKPVQKDRAKKGKAPALVGVMQLLTMQSSKPIQTH
jgi:hypothetical protein